MKYFVEKNWLLILIILQPILDIIAYFQYDSSVGTLAGYVRLLLMCVIAGYALIQFRKKVSIWIFFGILGIYCLLHIANCFRVGYLNFTEDIAYMLRVVQMPLLGISFCYLIREESQKQQVIKGFLINFIIIVVTMILAGISGTGNYTYDIYKLGYTGWFANANSQSIIVVTLIPFVIYFAYRTQKNLLVLAAAILAAGLLLINGTRAAYLSIVIILGGFACYWILEMILERIRKEKKNGINRLLMSVLFIGIAVLSLRIYPLTPRYEIDTMSQGKRQEESAEIETEKKEVIGETTTFDLNEFLKEPGKKEELIAIYKDKMSERLVKKFGPEKVLEEYGWLPDSYTLADVRLQKRIYAKLMWQESDTLTHFFGMEFTNMAEGDLENDYPAIYYYYGYVGLGLYIIYLVVVLGWILKAVLSDWKKIFTTFNFTLILVYVLQIALAQFSGAILRRPNASIYMSLVIALIFYQCRKIDKNRS